MNPHAPAPVSIKSLASSLITNGGLISQLVRREIVGRYKGSVMGLLWSFINPIMLLALYTLVFSGVFKARWGSDGLESKSQFALILFIGMIVHSMFSEVLIRAPSLIVSNVSYVKKIVFPLEILPVVALGASVFHCMANVLVLVFALFLINGSIPWTAIFLPLVLLPLLVFSLGIAWVFASLGVYLRDISHPIGFGMTVLLFASPVFYPVSALPRSVQPWLIINPLTFIIEQARAIMIFGQLPNFNEWLIYSLISFVVAWGGYVWFQKTRKGFANVL